MFLGNYFINTSNYDYNIVRSDLMKKLNDLIEERKLQYETTISMDIDTSKFADYLATMSVDERNEYFQFLEEEKRTASEKLNNPSQIEEDIKKEIIFNAIKFIDSMKYVSEYSLDLQELINRALKKILV